MLDAMKTMAYDVATVGAFELRRGIDYTQRAAARGGFEVVSANIYRDGAQSVRPFAPYTIRKVGARRFGIIGVIAKEPAGQGGRGGVNVEPVFLEREKVTITDPIVAIQELLPEVKKKSNVVVVLAHTGLPRAKELAALIPEIDIIIVGHGAATADQPGPTRTIVVQSGQRSDRVGTLRVVTDQGEITDWSAQAILLHQDQSPFDPGIRTVIWEYLNLDPKTGEKRNEAPKPKPDTLAADLPEATQDDRESRVAMKGDHFLGVESCKDCHIDEWAQWSETAHAHAYQTLAETENDWNNPACLPCHTTGYALPGGHSAVVLSPALWNVQCEECHGMGTEHTFASSEVLESTCLRCHTEDQDPDFDFARDIVGMIH
jgi:hypothetical protein